MKINEIFEILNKIEPKDSFEVVSFGSALNRVLYEDIYANKSLPCFDNSALDGYAYNYDDKDRNLVVLGTIFAGDKAKYTIQKGECYKIMTGAKMPENSDSIVMLEDSKFDENDRLIIPKDAKRFNARRLCGEEVKKGEILLKKGEILTPAKIMLLASQGISHFKVYTKLRIAIFSSGDEIIEPWQSCDDLEIYNTNAVGISSFLANFGFASEYKGIIKDDKNALKSSLTNALDYDIIITSGGASKGEADFMQTCLFELGFSEIFSHIKSKPAKPTKLFKKDNKLAIVLPGNPMSCILGLFLNLIAIRRLAGFFDASYKKAYAKFEDSLKFSPNRSNLILGNYQNGKFNLINGNNFGSGMITPLAKANSLYISNFGEEFMENEIEIYLLS